MQRLGACLLAAAAICLAAAAAAQGNFVATTADPAGDAIDPNAGRDIIGASMSYDRRSGELIGAVQLRGVPGGARASVSAASTETRVHGVPGRWDGIPNRPDRIPVTCVRGHG